jgi:hypothetical protein
MTVVGTYLSPEDAKAVEQKMRTLIAAFDNGETGEDFSWVGDSCVDRRGKKVLFCVETNGDTEVREVQDVMARPGGKVVAYDDYQEVDVAFEAPWHLKVQKFSTALALVLPSNEVSLIRKLNQACGKPKRKKNKKTKRQEFVWKYAGHRIYDEEEDLLLDVDMENLKKWTINYW